MSESERNAHHLKENGVFRVVREGGAASVGLLREERIITMEPIDKKGESVPRLEDTVNDGLWRRRLRERHRFTGGGGGDGLTGVGHFHAAPTCVGVRAPKQHDGERSTALVSVSAAVDGPAFAATHDEARVDLEDADARKRDAALAAITTGTHRGSGTGPTRGLKGWGQGASVAHRVCGRTLDWS